MISSSFLSTILLLHTNVPVISFQTDLGRSMTRRKRSFNSQIGAFHRNGPLNREDPFDGPFDDDQEYLGNWNDDFDLEAAREKLESLVSSSKGGEESDRHSNHRQEINFRPTPSFSRKFKTSNLPFKMDVALSTPPPVLTTKQRSRREMEIKWLGDLESCDNALENLWTLWFQERGPEAAARLLRADDFIGQGPQGWKEAEHILRDLVQAYGVHWAEPLNRLATLYFLQGKFEESELLCRLVLTVKPWHFGALSGIVMVYAGLHEAEFARTWAGRRLPSLEPSGNNRRRAVWVRNAVADAKKALRDAEDRLHETFGTPDDHSPSTITGRLTMDYEEEEEAWQ